MTANQERFIAQRVSAITDKLIDGRDQQDDHKFRHLAQIVSALFHYEFHAKEQAAIKAWDQIGSSPQAATLVSSELSSLLDSANYTKVTQDELHEAMERESLIALRLDVDLDDFDEVLISRRASHTETITVPKWKGLRSRDLCIQVYERVVIHTRVKPQSWFDAKSVDPADLNLIPGHASLKQFQNVPRADIEMLIPSTQVRFRLMDTLMVGIPALASGIVVVSTKLLPTLALLFVLGAAWLGTNDEQPELDQTALAALFGGTVTLGGFMFRQYNKLKNRKVQYLKTLSENLYLRTLADGPGVFHTLLASAEEQEVIEVLLAYRLLSDIGSEVHMDQLDAEVESWLRTHCDLEVDFEVHDAVGKLLRLDLATKTDAGLVGVDIDTAIARLNQRWDDIFTMA